MFKSTTFKGSALALASVMLLAQAAQASTLNITSVVGEWTATDPGAPGVTGQNTNEIRWGNPSPFSGSIPDDQSGYRFDGVAPPTQVGVASETNFSLGTFTHFNNPIMGTFLETATLEVDITFDILNDLSQVIDTRTVTSVFDFEHLETTNNPPGNNALCPDGNRENDYPNQNGCADRVTAVTNVGTSETFTIGDETFVFDVVGFCPDCQNPTLLDEFWTVENATNEAQLIARWTSEVNAVPLPAAGWLLLAGVGGLAAVGRRRKKA